MNPPLNRAVIPLMQWLIGPLFTIEKSTAELAVEKKTIPTDTGDTIRALWYCPKDIGENAPCLIYYHGGGFVLPAAPYHYSLANEFLNHSREVLQNEVFTVGEGAEAFRQEIQRPGG